MKKELSEVYHEKCHKMTNFFLTNEKALSILCQKYKPLYGKTILSEEPGDILLLTMSKYKVSVLVGLMANKMPLDSSVFEARPRPNQFREEFLALAVTELHRWTTD